MRITRLDKLVPALAGVWAFAPTLSANSTRNAGLHDFEFTLYDVENGGTLIAGPIQALGVQVTAGLFTVEFDFGTSAFDGDERWLAIAVRPAGGGSFTPLSPRQKLTPGPYSLLSLSFRLPYFGSVASGTPAFKMRQTGAAEAGVFEISNPAGNAATLEARTDGMGPAGFFWINNVNNVGNALHAKTLGGGYALWAENLGPGNAAIFANAQNGPGAEIVTQIANAPAIQASNMAGGPAIQASGSIRAAQFIVAADDEGDAARIDAPPRQFKARVPGGASVLAVWSSPDGGVTWPQFYQVSYHPTRLNDKPHMTADHTVFGPFADSIYVAWIIDVGVGPFSDIYFSFHRPGAPMFSPPAKMCDPPSGVSMGNGPNVAVAPDGAVYVVWLDFDVTLGGQTPGILLLDRSYDGGMTWGPDTPVRPILTVPNALSTQTGPCAVARSYPCLAVSPRNPLELYLVYAEDPDGVGGPDEADVFFIKSMDGGFVWGPPLNLSDPAGYPADQFEPWIADWCIGDTNGDGVIDAFDIEPFINGLLSP